MTLYGYGKKTKNGTLTGIKVEKDGETLLYGKYKRATGSVKQPKTIIEQMLEDEE